MSQENGKQDFSLVYFSGEIKSKINKTKYNFNITFYNL